MSGNKIFADTNILLYLLNGDETLADFLEGKQLYMSFITQLELLSYGELSESEQDIIEDMLKQCVIIDINAPIKQKTIQLRRQYKIKLPDSIIMATAIYLDLPIITADDGFKKVEELNLVYYEK